MSEIRELVRQDRHEELWQLCCGFLDLSLEQFMAIQKRLLLEQTRLLNRCTLGRKLMRGALPETVAEFRTQVPKLPMPITAPNFWSSARMCCPQSLSRGYRPQAGQGNIRVSGCQLATDSGKKLR